MADIALRTLDPGDLEALFDLRAHAFGGPRQSFDEDALVVPCEGTVAAYQGDRLVGTVSVIDMHQWFGGRAVSCGGVAGVTVAPDQRRRGLARALLDEAVRHMHEKGQSVSSLYPTTASLYRSLGWEVAGGWARTAIASADLPAPSGEVDWAPAAHTDPALAKVYEACAQGRDGWIVPPRRWWHAHGRRRELASRPAWSWIGRRQGQPVSAVVYHHASSERAMVDIEADLVVGADGDALGDALSFLGASGTTVDRVRTSLPPGLLRLHVEEPSRTKVVEDWPWMVRLIDLPAAITARDWPAGLTATVSLDVHSPYRGADSATAGRWVLQVADGTAQLTAGGDGTTGVTACDLARLYAGAVDPAALAAAGRLTGADDRTVSSLRAAFAGDPSSPFFF